jgi:hypothetical protein
VIKSAFKTHSFLKQYSLIALTLTSFLLLSSDLHASDNSKIRTLQSGDYVIFGIFNGQLIFNNGDSIGDPNLYDPSLFLARFDESGTTQWVKTFKSNPYLCGGNCPGIGLSVDQHDNIYITGGYISYIEFDSSHSFINPNVLGAFIAKFDSAGNYIWGQQSLINTNSIGVDVDVDSNGNVYATGTFYHDSLTFGALNPVIANSYGEDIYIVKFDSAGDAQWLRQLHGGGTGNGSNHQVYSIDVDDSGEVCITGYFGGTYNGTLHFGNLTLSASSAGNFEVFNAVCSTAGIPKWIKKTSSMTGSDFPEQSIGSNNHIYNTGYFTQTSQFGLLPVLTAGYMDAFIVSYDTSGSAEWVLQASPGFSTTSAKSTGITADISGNIYNIGYYSDSIEFFPLPALAPASGYGYLVKLDASGSALCQAVDQLEMEDVSVDQTGNIYVISGDPSNFFFSDFTVSKWDSNCNLLWSSNIWHLLNMNIAEHIKKLINVYPNPAKTNITVDAGNYEIKRIEITTMSGHLIKAINKAGQQINIADLTDGLYIVTAIGNNFISSEKFLKLNADK